MGGLWSYLEPMATGHVERLKSGYRAKVYAASTRSRRSRSTSTVRFARPKRKPSRNSAQLLKQAKAKRSPDRSATVVHLLDKWMEIADHELSTARFWNPDTA